jgi:acetyl coenzyme A synthetase (ADP forming)-like protein
MNGPIEEAGSTHPEPTRTRTRIASLRPFFRPRSVALVGASRDPASIGHRLLEALVRHGFQGALYPINPSVGALLGLPVYPSVAAVPGPVDLAVIAVPAGAVAAVVEDCARKRVPALVVISSGFAECGSAGRQLQDRLLSQVRDRGMRLVGPNCLGLVSNEGGVRLSAVFVDVSPPAGRVAMSSESGALGLAVLAAARRLEIGFSSFVSIGNRADVSSNDLLEYWEQDEGTLVILLYLESFGNPRRFARIARRVGRRKPIVAVKAGRTRAGRRAAGSHTAALAVNEVAVDALFHQTGVIRAETLQEMFDLVTALCSQPLPRGRRVGLLTNAGGPAILCADACEGSGLVLPELSLSVQGELRMFLPAAASLGNPVDLIASALPEHFRQAIVLLLRSGEVDALIVLYVAAGLAGGEAMAAAVAGAVAEARQGFGAIQPVLACWMPDAVPPLRISAEEKIPCYAFPEEPARVLAKLAAYAQWRSRSAGTMPSFTNIDVGAARSICQHALRERGPGWLDTVQVCRVLRAFGLPVASGGVAATAEEAADLAQTLGFPVAVKLASRQIVHKSEFGAVRLNLDGTAEVRRAFGEIHDGLARAGKLAAMEGVLVQPMIRGGTEVMVGMTHDPLFGPLLVFGLGGIHVEILGDISCRVPPLTDLDAREMVRSIRGFKLLEGYRGHPASDVGALEDVLLRVSRLVDEVPEIHELDLNPVVTLPPGQGGWIVDARIAVAPAF